MLQYSTSQLDTPEVRKYRGNEFSHDSTIELRTVTSEQEAGFLRIQVVFFQYLCIMVTSDYHVNVILLFAMGTNFRFTCLADKCRLTTCSISILCDFIRTVGFFSNAMLRRVQIK